MSEKHCLNCDYAQETQKAITNRVLEIGARQYHCQYNPPIPVVVGVNESGPVIMPLFPPVNAAMSCSHWSGHEDAAILPPRFNAS